METTTITTTSSIPRTRCVSSNLASYGYDPVRQVLAIEFTSGALYEYDGVPATIFALLAAAASKGATYAQWIRASYPGRKIVRAEGACEDCGARGPIGTLCTDCGCGLHRDDDDPRPLRDFFRPTRVLVNEEGEATAPDRTHVKADVIFVRDDGWSLGAPRALAAVARRTWEGRWTQVWRRTDDGQWEQRWPVPA